MKDEQIYKLMELLPPEYLDEDLQFHLQRAAEPSRPHRLADRLAALFRKRKPALPHNEIDDLMREAVRTERTTRFVQTDLKPELPEQSQKPTLPHNEIDDLMCEAVRTERANRSVQTDLKPKLPEQSQADFINEETHARKLNKAALILIFAAILAIGGTTAAVGYSLHKQNRNSENRLESELSENETAPNTDNAVISPKLTNQTDTPDCHTFAEADGGFFYTVNLPTTEEEQQMQYNRFMDGVIIIQQMSQPTGLKYFDEASGQSVFVCADPDCLHDRCESCNATTKNFSIVSDPVWLDGYVYAVALDNRELLKNPDQCTKYPVVLLRWSPDGSDLTAATWLCFSDQPLEVYAELIAHRGQLWISCNYVQWWSTRDENMNISESGQNGKFEMYCYEPEPQKLTAIVSSGEWKDNYRNYSSQKPGCCDLKGIGTYVYFHKPHQDWQDPFKGAGIFRIDCRTGEIEQVVDIKSDKSIYYTIGDGIAYYDFSRDGGSNYITDKTVIKAFNMETGEETEIASPLAIAKEQASWMQPNMLDGTSDYNAEIWLDNLIADKDRLYLFWSLWDLRENYETRALCLTELDSSGNVLHTANLSDAKNLEFSEDVIRSCILQTGYMYQTKKWIGPDQATNDDIAMFHAQGGWLTEDGEWIDPRKIKSGDMAEYLRSGFFLADYIWYEPEELTEEIIQHAIENWKKDSLVLSMYDSERSGVAFNGTSFYLTGNYAFYRMTPEEAFGEMRAERLFFKE